MTPPTTVQLSSLLLLPVCSTATPRLKNPTVTTAAHGVRWPRGGIRRRRRVGRCWAAVVEETGAQEDGVLLPKEGDEAAAAAAERYDWREEWYPLYLSKEVPDDAALPLTVFDRQLVLYRDADGVLRCHEDRCPHRLAKLSEGQLVDGKLECLYHGWQFDGQGKCVKIPQLPEGAKIPRNACARNYEVRDSQGVVWVWMSDANPADERKLPWFEPYARPGFTDLSTVHELPYDHSILLENLMDPAHVPISHDRTDWTAKREDAQPLFLDVTERTERGFAGYWGRTSATSSASRRPACSPTRSSSSTRTGRSSASPPTSSAVPPARASPCSSSASAPPSVRRLPRCSPPGTSTRTPARCSSRTWVSSPRRTRCCSGRRCPPRRSTSTSGRRTPGWQSTGGGWTGLGTGCPTTSVTAACRRRPCRPSFAAKGGIGTQHAPNPTNRYFRHVVHCKGCRATVNKYTSLKNVFAALAAAAVAAAILAATRQWKAVLLASAAVLAAASYACGSVVSLITTNFIRTHRRL